MKKLQLELLGRSGEGDGCSSLATSSTWPFRSCSRLIRRAHGAGRSLLAPAAFQGWLSRACPCVRHQVPSLLRLSEHSAGSVGGAGRAFPGLTGSIPAGFAHPRPWGLRAPGSIRAWAAAAARPHPRKDGGDTPEGHRPEQRSRKQTANATRKNAWIKDIAWCEAAQGCFLWASSSHMRHWRLSEGCQGWRGARRGCWWQVPTPLDGAAAHPAGDRARISPR